jgi:hypothetical protein
MGEGAVPVAPGARLLRELAARLGREVAPAATLQGRMRDRLPAARHWVEEHWEALSGAGADERYRAQAGEEEPIAQVLAYLLAQSSGKGPALMAFPDVVCQDVTDLSEGQVAHLLRVTMRVLDT